MYMDFKEIKFTGTDLIKSLGGLTTVLVAYFNLVGEIRQNRVNYEADKRILEYRIESLEKAKGSSEPVQNHDKEFRLADRLAIMPKDETSLKDDDD